MSLSILSPGRRRAVRLVGLGLATLMAVSSRAKAGSGGVQGPVVEVGLVSKRSFCRGGVVLLERRLEAFLRRSPRFRPLRARPEPAPEADSVDSVRVVVQGLLDEEHVWLVAIQDDGKPLLIVRVPDVPRAQLQMWEHIEAMLQP